ncbi:MAG: DUF4416 family protein [Candidatus Marinimicrobia bacterium]|nr:DUF4416 family protein [Candidatus Neomarinimicrobiota bacterium]
MAKIKESPFAHPFFAIMYNKVEDFNKTVSKVKSKYGEILAIGDEFKVIDFTDYYVKEFGENLKKRFMILKNAVKIDNYYRTKIWSNELEYNLYDEWISDKRIINLDPGYFTPSKLILYSTKNYSHRMYINDGIYAEVTLIYEHNDYKFLPWTYPDYKWEKNIQFLKTYRNKIVEMSRDKNYSIY